MADDKATLLLVEDDEVTAKSIRDFLTDAGYNIIMKVTGDEGLDAALNEEYDLLLLDLWLPKVNGFEILEALNNENKMQNMDVLILSNSGQPVEINKAKTMGVNDFLIKANITPEEVKNKVEKILNE